MLLSHKQAFSAAYHSLYMQVKKCNQHFNINKSDLCFQFNANAVKYSCLNMKSIRYEN